MSALFDKAVKATRAAVDAGFALAIDKTPTVEPVIYLHNRQQSGPIDKTTWVRGEDEWWRLLLHQAFGRRQDGRPLAKALWVLNWPADWHSY